MGSAAPDPFAFDPFALLAPEDARAVAQALPDVPVAWIRGVEALQTMSLPDGATADRWAQILADAQLFINRWGSTAAACGWTTGNVFGMDDDTHSEAYGLVIAMRGRRLAAIDADRVYLIDDTATHKGRYYRQRQIVRDDAQPIWQRGVRRHGR